MSNYTPEAQQSINSAESKLGDAINNLRNQSKENNTAVEVIPDSQPDTEVVIDAPKEPRRSEFVKTDDPKVLERINDLYGQVKKSDNRNQMITEHNRLMEQKLAEYQERLAAFEKNQKTDASNKVESELRAQLKTAREEGDYDAVDSIEDKLLDLRLERRLGDKQPVQKQETQIPQQSQQLSHDEQYLYFMGGERDTHGNLVRPYLFDWHPDNQKALDLFINLPREFAAAGKAADLKTIIDTIDERMKGKKPQGQVSVLGGEGGDLPERRTVKLTQAQINVARNMGITPEAYARQLQLINS